MPSFSFMKKKASVGEKEFWVEIIKAWDAVAAFISSIVEGEKEWCLWSARAHAVNAPVFNTGPEHCRYSTAWYQRESKVLFEEWT